MLRSFVLVERADGAGRILDDAEPPTSGGPGPREHLTSMFRAARRAAQAPAGGQGRGGAADVAVAANKFGPHIKPIHADRHRPGGGLVALASLPG